MICQTPHLQKEQEQIKPHLTKLEEEQHPSEEKRGKMEVSMSLNSLIRLPMKSKSTTVDEYTSIIRHSLHSTRPKCPKTLHQKLQFVVEAKGKKGMMTRQFQRPGPPPLPKIEDDGNPRFVIFIRMANVCFLSLSLLLLYCNLIFHKLLYHFCYLICVYKDVNFSQLGT